MTERNISWRRFVVLREEPLWEELSRILVNSLVKRHCAGFHQCQFYMKGGKRLTLR